MSYFSVKNLYKKWPSAIVDFSYECEKASMTCILGASGCGKSTILNIIAGLEKADLTPSSEEVEITLDGRRIEKLPARQREIGMVFQSGALFNHMTVLDNVAYGLISKGMKKREAREKASAYLGNFNLDGMDKRMPQTLSGGEKQRVALARTLIMEPKLVLLDEPLSALDADLRKHLAAQISQWQKEIGFTALMVTHDEEEAESLADKIIRLPSPSKS